MTKAAREASPMWERKVVRGIMEGLLPAAHRWFERNGITLRYQNHKRNHCVWTGAACDYR